MKTKKSTLYFLFVATALIVFGEIISKFYLGLGTPPLSIQHPTIEYLFRPNQDVYRFGNHFVTNEYGMRSDSFDLKKQNDELRIMVFGDSVINGGNLTDHEKLATTLLSKELKDLPENDKVIVGNISAGSWGPGNWLAYTQEYSLFDADIVILLISSHDYADNPSFSPLDKSTHPTRRPFSAFSEGAFRYLPRYLPKLRDAPITANVDPSLPEAKDISEGLNDLEAFLRLAQAQAGSVFVIQHWEKSEIATRLAKPGNQRIQEICTRLDIETLSLQPYFQRSIDDDVDPYRDNIHPNDVGQQLIKDAILESISD